MAELGGGRFPERLADRLQGFFTNHVCRLARIVDEQTIRNNSAIFVCLELVVVSNLSLTYLFVGKFVTICTRHVVKRILLSLKCGGWRWLTSCILLVTPRKPNRIRIPRNEIDSIGVIMAVSEREHHRQHRADPKTKPRWERFSVVVIGWLGGGTDGSS